MSYPSGGVPEFVASTELLASQLNKVVDAFNAMFPIGAVIHLTGRSATATENLINGIWLELNGVAVSRTTYADLNTLFGGASYPYGSGDGSTTFTLPDVRGRTLIHNSTASGNAATKTEGLSDSAALGSRNPKPSVSVSISGTTGSESSHTHALSSSGGGPGSSGTLVAAGNTGAGSAHSHSFSGSGSGTATTAYLVGGIYVIKAFA